MQSYTVYDLVVRSALPLPELVALPDLHAAPPDLTIELGKIDGRHLDHGGVFHHWFDDRCLALSVPKVGSFLITHGERIVIQPEPGVDEDAIRVFLLGSALGAVLLQRGALVLHGNSIRIGAKCLICVGESGAGKSSLAAGFMLRGLDVLADDVVPVNAAGQALPGFPRIKIWKDVADRLGISTDGLRRILHGFDKFSLPVTHKAELSSLPVGWIYILSPEDRDDVQIEPVGGHQRFEALLGNTYRNFYLEGMPGLRAHHLHMCGVLARETQIARVRRPKAGFQLPALMDALLAHAAQNA